MTAEFTPDVIRSMSFRENRRGYDCGEVDAFVTQAATAVEALQRRLAEQTERAFKAERALQNAVAGHQAPAPGGRIETPAPRGAGRVPTALGRYRAAPSVALWTKSDDLPTALLFTLEHEIRRSTARDETTSAGARR